MANADATPPAEIDGRPARILVVDDEPDLEILVRQKFRRRIRRGEFEFTFAQNGVEALERLAENPDLEMISPISTCRGSTACRSSTPSAR